MGTIDRMILRQFVVNAAALGLVVMLLVLTMDLAANGDEFVQAGAAHGTTLVDKSLGTLEAAAGFYGPMLILYAVQLGGLIGAGAGMFTAVTLVRNRELTALLAAGISVRRVLAPLVLGALAVNAAAWSAQEWAVPRYLTELMRQQSDVKSGGAGVAIDFVGDHGGGAFIAERLNPGTGTLRHMVYLRRDAAGVVTDHLSAETATWDPGARAWRLTGGRHFTRARPTDGVPASAADAPLLASTMDPRQLLLASSHKARRLLGTRELVALSSASPRRAAELTQIIYSRPGLLVANTAVALIGLTLILRRDPTRLLQRLAPAAAAALVLWVVAFVVANSPTGLMPALAAAWGPAMVYCLCGAGAWWAADT